MGSIKNLYNCPVCTKKQMSKLILSTNNDLVLDHCKRCKGIFFENQNLPQFRLAQLHSLKNRVKLLSKPHKMKCSSCKKPFPRNKLICPKCNIQNILNCPICQAPMKSLSQKKIHFDLCKECQCVWFDNIDLEKLHQAKLLIFAKGRPKSIMYSPPFSEVFTNFCVELCLLPTEFIWFLFILFLLSIALIVQLIQQLF